MRSQTEDHPNSFFARMLFLTTLLLAFFALISSIVVSRLSYQYEKSQLLKNYELAALNLSETFYNRQADFSHLAGKFIRDNQCDADLCSLLEAASYDEVPATVRSSCIRLLSDICMDDRYLSGFLLYSSEQEQLYCYSNATSRIYQAQTLPDFTMPPAFSRRTLSLEDINTLLSAFPDIDTVNNRHYGITATIYLNANKPLGLLIPLYSTSEYEYLLSGFNLEERCSYQIQDKDGRTFFLFNPTLSARGEVYYADTFTNTRYDYQVRFYLADPFIPSGNITYLVVFFGVLLSVFSFSLYYLTYYLTHKNIVLILDGMKQFRLNELSYRIHKPKGRNEFTQIIDGFNSMCDELEHSVEQSYVYELQQRKSEMYALQTSINPHFLYNTLEIIRSQIVSLHNGEAAQMTLLLSKIYRMQTNTNMFVTLEEEMELCENLMILYQYRFQNFEYDFSVEESCNRYALPKNTLQPLIENYFVHGLVANKQDNLFLLSITPKQQDGKTYVHLSLSNNGNPISEDRIRFLEEKLRSNIYAAKDEVGFALTNVTSRLRIVFQEDCKVLIGHGEDDMQFQLDFIFPAMTVEQLKDSFQ